MPYSKERIEEGYVASVARFRQSKNMSFRNLVFRRGVTPTDIDFSFDLNGNLFFQGEGKLKGKEMDNGQKKHFENLNMRLAMGGAISYCILFNHDVVDTSEIIYIDDCQVELVYTYDIKKQKGEWKHPKKIITVFECIKQIEKYCEKKLNIKL